jgi:hypothetical protein
VFEPDQASTVVDLALGGSRLLALGGANGMVFRRDPGQPEWTESFLKNTGISAGLTAQMAEWTGSGWVVGTNTGPFWSLAGQEPWTRVNLAIGAIDHSTFVTTNPRLVGAFSVATGCVVETSLDDGVSWTFLEFLPNVFTYALATNHGTIYGGRPDGLWRRDTPKPGRRADRGVRPPVRARRHAAGARIGAAALRARGGGNGRDRDLRRARPDRRRARARDECRPGRIRSR